MVIAVMISCVLALLAVGAAVAVAVWASRTAARAAAEAAQQAAEQAAARAADEAAARAAQADVAVTAALREAVEATRAQASAERDAAIETALRQTAVVQREQLDAKQEVIDSTLHEVRNEVRGELHRLHELVTTLQSSSAERFGQVEHALSAHAEVTGHLQQSANSLREALASSPTRGQWGERMADDVLRLAGFVENVNYVKQTQIEGATGRPDFTFPMPKGQQLFMDVKFPLTSYLKYLDAHTDAERETHLHNFLRDVRLRVKELAARDYSGSSDASVDYVLLFLPNEQLTGFIHEHDAQLLDDAMAQRIVLCSPLTLFAFLGVIRQAFDTLAVERTSDEILQLIGQFDTQWKKYTRQVDTVKKRIDSVATAVDELAGTRRRTLERPLQQIEDLRIRRGIPEPLTPTDEGEDQVRPLSA